MNKILPLSIFSVFVIILMSCGESDSKITTSVNNKSSTQDKAEAYNTAYINSVEMIDEIYVLDKEKARENGLTESQISEIQEELQHLNSAVIESQKHVESQIKLFKPDSIVGDSSQNSSTN